MQTESTQLPPLDQQHDYLLLRLSHSIKPQNGPALATLGDAASFIKELDGARRRLPVWEEALDKLLDAAIYGREADVEAATWCLEVALRQENSQR